MGRLCADIRVRYVSKQDYGKTTSLIFITLGERV